MQRRAPFAKLKHISQYRNSSSHIFSICGIHRVHNTKRSFHRFRRSIIAILNYCQAVFLIYFLSCSDILKFSQATANLILVCSQDGAYKRGCRRIKNIVSAYYRYTKLFNTLAMNYQIKFRASVIFGNIGNKA